MLRIFKMSRKQVDFWVVVAMLIISAFLGFIFRLKNIPLGALYLGVPSLYLFLRAKKNYKKIFWGVLIFGFLFGFVFDFIQILNQVWIVSRLLIPWKLFGIWPIENFFGYGFMTLFILVFYEHFLDDEKHPRLSKKHSKIFLFSLAVIALIIFCYTFNPQILKFSHAYLLGGLAAIVFPIIFSIYNPKIIKKFSVLATFFFFVWLLLEIVGIKLNNWAFPGGQFVGYVTLLGISFPVEEVLFWMLWHPATIVAYYEYFIDDQK